MEILTHIFGGACFPPALALTESGVVVTILIACITSSHYYSHPPGEGSGRGS